MKKFVDMADKLKIDGTYTGTLDGKNKSESELNARELSKIISDLSKRFYELLYEEPEETFKNRYDTYLGADLTLKGNCQQYLDGKGIQGIKIILAFNDERFDARTMVLPEYSDNRMYVKKAHSWAVTYADRIMQHALVETY